VISLPNLFPIFSFLLFYDNLMPSIKKNYYVTVEEEKSKKMFDERI
jgi:hypothetical protein